VVKTANQIQLYRQQGDASLHKNAMQELLRHVIHEAGKYYNTYFCNSQQIVCFRKRIERKVKLILLNK
jgi:hypothetical protein